MRNFEPALYAATVNARNVYVQTQWNQAQIALILHTVAFPLLFTPATDTVIKFVIGCVGLAATFFLTRTITRARSRIIYLDQRLIEMERLDTGSEGAVRIPVFDTPQYAQINHSEHTFRISAAILFVFWTVVTVRNGLILAQLQHAM
jgi:hypothetical protein